jgi:hypothetical protein
VIEEARRLGRHEREDEATARVAELEPRVPKLTIDVPEASRVPGLEVLRNGTPIQEGAWGTPLPVDPGNLEVIARAPSFKPWKVVLEVSESETRVAHVPHLEAAPPPPPPAVVLAPLPEKPSHWTPGRVWGASLVGASLVMAGVGTYFGVKAIDQRNAADAECPVYDGEKRCSQAGLDAMSNAQTSGWVANGLLFGALASAATGTVLYLTNPPKKEGATPTTGLTFRGLSGSF